MTSPRRAHVYRVYKTDSDGLIDDPEVWLDVMRIDRIVFNEQRGAADGATHQERKYVVSWGDNTINSGGMFGGDFAPFGRVNTRLTVKEPPASGQDKDDPSLASVDMPIVKASLIAYRGGQSGATNQDVKWVFRNDHEEETGRKVKIRRIIFNDLNDRGADFFGEAPNKGDLQPPMSLREEISWETYLKALQEGTKDDSQFVDVEVIDSLRLRFPPSPWDKSGMTASLGQEVTYVPINTQQEDGGPLGVEDWFQAPPGSGTEAGPDDPGGVYRLDPFQCIVNVSWGGLAVDFGDHAEDAPEPDTPAP